MSHNRRNRSGQWSSDSGGGGKWRNSNNDFNPRHSNGGNDWRNSNGGNNPRHSNSDFNPRQSNANANWRDSNSVRDFSRNTNDSGDRRNQDRSSGGYSRNQNGSWRQRDDEDSYQNDRSDRRQQHRRDNRPQPYQTNRPNRRSNYDEDQELTSQRFHGGSQRQSSSSYQAQNLMDAPPMPPAWLPPPPIPPMFGNGRRSFPGQSHDSSFSSGSNFRTSHSHNDTVAGMMQEQGVVTLSDDDHEEEGEINDEDSNDEHKYLQAQLNQALGLQRGQVPEYILRMRRMGPHGYPPSLIDEHVRSKNSLPFFGGTVETILPKKKVTKEALPAFRGFTHLEGHEVSDEFLNLMQQLSKIDHKQCHQDAMERSGIEEFKTTVELQLEEDAAATKRKTEVIRYEIPEHEVSESKDYLFASETGALKHNLDDFAAGIQPFQNSHINKPTGFLSKLESILKKKEPKENGDQ